VNNYNHGIFIIYFSDKARICCHLNTLRVAIMVVIMIITMIIDDMAKLPTPGHSHMNLHGHIDDRYSTLIVYASCK
jgi:hypothetical protein